MEINKLIYGDNEFNMAPTVTDYTLSNGEDKVIKFANGMMIIAGKRTFTGISITSSWGNIYESAQIQLGDFAVSFTGVPTITANVIGDVDCIMQYVKGTTSSSIGYTFFSSGVTKTGNVTVNFIAFGFWK